MPDFQKKYVRKSCLFFLGIWYVLRCFLKSKKIIEPHGGISEKFVKNRLWRKQKIYTFSDIRPNLPKIEHIYPKTYKSQKCSIYVFKYMYKTNLTDFQILVTPWSYFNIIFWMRHNFTLQTNLNFRFTHKKRLIQPKKLSARSLFQPKKLSARFFYFFLMRTLFKIGVTLQKIV